MVEIRSKFCTFQLNYFSFKTKHKSMIILVLYSAILVNLTFSYIIGPLEDCEYGNYGTECRQFCGNCSGQVNVICYWRVC